MSGPLTTLRCFILLAVLGVTPDCGLKDPAEHHPGPGLCGAQRVGLSPRYRGAAGGARCPPVWGSGSGAVLQHRVRGTVPGPPRGGGSGQRRGSAGPRLLQLQLWDDEKRGGSIPSHSHFFPYEPYLDRSGGTGVGCAGGWEAPWCWPGAG